MRARESSVCKTLSLQISSQEHAGAKERKTSVTNLRYHTPPPPPLLPPYDLRYQISRGFFFRRMLLDILTLCRLTLESDDLFKLLGYRNANVF